MAGLFARIQVSLNRDGLLPEDVSTNTWHFEGDFDSPIEDYRVRWDEDIDGVCDRVELMYQSLGPYLASTLAGSGTIKAYDMRDDRPRIPRHTRTFTFTPATTAYPAEVALVVSFRAALESGTVASRRRGRVFLGPLATAVGQVVGADVVVNSSTISAILPIVEAMTTGGANTFRLAIYSERNDPTAAGDTDAAWEDAAVISIDNAFDTQRRRGARATARTELAIS